MARTQRRDSRGRFAGGGGGGGGGGQKKGRTPKTTSARGRAQAVERRASQALKSGGGGSKAARSKYIAQRARDYYKATGTGKKRSAVKAKPKATVAERKQALVKKVSSDVLAGRKVSSAARSYVRAQQSSKQTKTGKGSKAKRRMASLG